MAKVLLIEDDPVLIELYKIIFSKNNMELILAVDGEDGLLKVKELRPDIVLLDIMMPKMNGIEVLKNIKADPQTQPTRVVMLTNLADPNVQDIAAKTGAEKYVIKSQVLPQDVVEMVRQMMGQ